MKEAAAAILLQADETLVKPLAPAANLYNPRTSDSRKVYSPRPAEICALCLNTVVSAIKEEELGVKKRTTSALTGDNG